MKKLSKVISFIKFCKVKSKQNFFGLFFNYFLFFSAFIDSLMDITTSITVFITIWAINNTNSFNYPRGRQRLEIVSVIVCSVFMGVTNIMMIIQSLQAILNNTAR